MEDKVLRLTIGFIKSCYDKGDVERLVTTSTNTLKSQLSYISKLNVRSSMIISKIAEIEIRQTSFQIMQLMTILWMSSEHS